MIWQPIETAPEDGTLVDLWSPDKGRLASCRWYIWDDFCGWEQTFSERPDLAFPIDVMVTHWMPLPEPPKQENP